MPTKRAGVTQCTSLMCCTPHLAKCHNFLRQLLHTVLFFRIRSHLLLGTLPLQRCPDRCYLFVDAAGHLGVVLQHLSKRGHLIEHLLVRLPPPSCLPNPHSGIRTGFATDAPRFPPAARVVAFSPSG